MPSLNFARTEGVESNLTSYLIKLSDRANKADQLEIENRQLKLELESLKRKNEIDSKLIKEYFVENTKKLTDLLHKQQHEEKKPPHTNPHQFIQMLKDNDESLVDFYYLLYESLDPKSKKQNLENLKSKTMFFCYHLVLEINILIV